MLGINANTEHPEAAWKLVEFMTREAVLVQYYSNQFPAQKTPLQNIEFGPALGGFAEQLQLARSWGAYSDSPAQIGKMWNSTGRALVRRSSARKATKRTAGVGQGSVEVDGSGPAGGVAPPLPLLRGKRNWR